VVIVFDFAPLVRKSYMNNRMLPKLTVFMV